MHLVKRRSQALSDLEVLEDAFTAKYDWLLNWALSFANGDRAVAEDLVQDTFVRFIVAQGSIENPDHAEPLLYTYLKYVYLAHQRRAQRHASHHVDVVDFDSIESALQSRVGDDLIRAQSELRRVVAWLCWRKESAKSASILILRVIHGYLSKEIMRVGILSQRGVAKGLAAARAEAARNLADTENLHVIGRNAAPALAVDMVAVPYDRFLRELRQMIFDACQTPCLPKEELLRHYNALNSKPIEATLLAHIVSCESCLDTLNDSFQMPRLRKRSPEEMTTGRKKYGNGRAGNMRGNHARRAFQDVLARIQHVYDHQPRSLSIAVNGQVLATRDISSRINRMEVNTGAEARVEFVEITSEQDICLLAVPVVAVPPAVGPEVRHELPLGNERKLALLLRFAGNGTAIEVLYEDHSVAQEEIADEEDAPADRLILASGNASFIADRPRMVGGLRLLWQRFRRYFQRTFVSQMNPLLTSAAVLAIASVICVLLWWKSVPAMTSTAFLQRAETWDIGAAESPSTGVIRQTVTIRSSQHAIKRTIYRDIEGRRRARREPLSADANFLWTRLTLAGVNWDEPLSGSGYRFWHDGARIESDSVAQSGRDLLTLTTTVSSGPVAQESLTLRCTDFHPVKRTIAFRDAETVEIAEVDYSVLPWSPATENQFEPLAAGSAASDLPLHPSIFPHVSHVLSDMALDEAELEVRLALNRLGADRTERIELVRRPDGIQVKGIVATSERKQEIESELHQLAHVVSAIYTFQEFQDQATADGQIGSIHQADAVAGEAPLEKYLLQHGRTREDARRLSERLFNDVAAVTFDGTAMSDLVQRFDSGRPLTTEAETVLSQLLAKHQANLIAALSDEEEVIAEAGFNVAAAYQVPGSAGEGLLGAGDGEGASAVNRRQRSRFQQKSIGGIA
jgi:DNA-directed RNA polymerase specialized sigma24 family protein